MNTVERIDLRIVDPQGGLKANTQADDGEDDDVRVHELSARLEIRLVYHHGVVKKHSLHLHASQFLRVIVDPDSTPSGFQISARELKDWLEHFSIAFGGSINPNGLVKGDSQLAWRFGQQEVRVRNFDTGPSSSLFTEIKLNVGEFRDYGVFHDDGNVDLALPMREFKVSDAQISAVSDGSQAALQLADQFVMDLDIRFSEASQPLTLSSMYIGLDRYNNETTLFEIFCAIATTKCDVFNEATTQKNQKREAAAESSASTRQPSIATSRDRSVSVQAPAKGGASHVADQSRRASATPLRASSSNRPSRLRASLSMTSEAPRATTTQAQADPEPLFQSGGSQSVRLTQEEALEMAGFTFEDLDQAMDDADLDDEAGGAEGDNAQDSEVPSGWDEISFDNLPAENMSTQRQQAEKVAQAPQETETRSPDVPGGVTAPAEESTGSRVQHQFEPDDNIFGDSSTPAVKAEPVDQEEDEELEPDELGATQDSSGRKVSTEMGGYVRFDANAVPSLRPSSPTELCLHRSSAIVLPFIKQSLMHVCNQVTCQKTSLSPWVRRLP